MIRFTCPACQKTLQTAPQTAGKRVACPCGHKMQVPIPMATAIEQTPQSQPVMGLHAAPASFPDPFGPPGFSNAASPAPSPSQVMANQYLADAQRYHRDQQAAERQANQSGGGVFATESSILNSGTIGGGLAMLGAIIWFFGGLAAGVIFFYPPILFIMGLVGFVKGIVSR